MSPLIPLTQHILIGWKKLVMHVLCFLRDFDHLDPSLWLKNSIPGQSSVAALSYHSPVLSVKSGPRTGAERGHLQPITSPETHLYVPVRFFVRRCGLLLSYWLVSCLEIL